MSFQRRGIRDGSQNDDPWNIYHPPASNRIGTDAYDSGAQIPLKRSFSPRAIAIICIAISIALTVSFGFLAFMNTYSEENGGVAEEGTVPEDYDNFQDYFEDYFQGGTDLGTNNLPRTDPDPSRQMTLLTGGGKALSLQAIYDKCSVSIVAITSSINGEEYSWGTGIIMSEDGYIITNSHVLDNCDSAAVTLYDNREFEAKLVGRDSLSDIAIIKIECSGLISAEFGSSSDLRVGDEVVAIGNPLGEELRGTMTDGIVSAINRDINYDGNYMTLIQTNAAINGGNSGGALIDMSGRVVGITNMKIISSYTSVEGIGFAIPTGTVKPVVDEIMRSGYVAGHPGIGITVGSIPESAQQQYDMPNGVYVSEVTPGSGAELAGLLPGDVITAADGVKVTSTAELNVVKGDKGVGDSILLTVWRDGDEFTAEVVMMDMSALFK